MKLSLRTKLILEILPIFLGIVIGSSSFVVFMTNKAEKDLSYKQLTESARGYANQLDADMRAYQATGRTITTFIEQYSGGSREQVSAFLQHALEEDLSLAGLFVIYEPDGFDQADARYSGAPGYDSTGRFALYWNRLRQPGKVTSEIPEDYANADYYNAVKNTLNASIREPFFQNNLLIVRYVFPIQRSGQFAGVVGIDAAPSALEQIVSNITAFKTGYAFLVSRDASLLSHKDKSLVGKVSLPEYGQEKNLPVFTEIAQKIRIGSEGYRETRDPLTGKPAVMFFSPVKTTGWGLVIATPISEIMANTDQFRNLLIVLASIAVVFLIFYILKIASSIANPVLKISQAAEQLASGDLDVELKVNSKDEIGQTADSFRRMVAYLHGIARAADEVARGDLARTVAPQSERDVLGNAFVAMTAALRQTVRQVTDSANQVEAASGQLAATSVQSGQATAQIAATVQQVARGAADQTGSVNRTTTSMMRMSHAIDAVAQGGRAQAQAIGKAANLTSGISEAVTRVAEKAQSVTRYSEAAGASARDGARMVKDTIDEIHAVQEKVAVSVEKVAGMGDRSQKISAIVSTIEEIASQTNMLAVNAAIETARAEIQADTLTEATLDRQMVAQAHLLNHILCHKTEEFTTAFWTQLAQAAGLDSICITDSDGVIVHCNDPKIMGWRFPDDPKEQASVFRKLIHQTGGVVCQKAQIRSVDKVLFKYIGVSRQDEPGVVQVGFQADSLTRFRLKLGGFAVVAEEVRRLSDKSKGAAKEIASLVKDIQKAVSEATEAMNAGAREVDLGTRRAQASGEAIQAIQEAVASVLSQAQQSAQAAQQMSTSAGQLVKAMDDVSAAVDSNTLATGKMTAEAGEVSHAMEAIAAISEENSAAVEEVSASAEEMNAQVEEVSASARKLAMMAQELQQTVSKFRLSAEVETPHEQLVAQVRAQVIITNLN